MTLVELCCGTASVSLWAMACVGPLTGYMGSKRRWAPLLVEALGLRDPERVVLVDAGPWGDLWQILATGPEVRAELAAVLTGWDRHPLEQLWGDCVSRSPWPDPVLRAAQFLFLQARAAGSIPVWWSESLGRWRSPTGTRETNLELRHKGGSKREGPAYQGTDPKRRGLQRPSTIARRLRALEVLPWDRIEVHHGDLSWYSPRPGDTVYIDPPYQGCPRYAALLPRSELLEKARYWTFRGARVAISEAEPLPLDGWTARQLPHSKPEWVTASFPWELPRPPAARQLELWSAA